ncbi:hypothetical protein Efla_005420 [Eimeria flavescens]
MSDIESQRVLGAGIPRTGRLVDVVPLYYYYHIISRSIVWISLIQVAVYAISCAMSSAFELGCFDFDKAAYSLHPQHMGLDKEIKYGKRDFLILYFSSGESEPLLLEFLANNRLAALIGNMLTVVMRPCSLVGLVGSILAEILMVWHKLDERTRNMYTLDITVFGALMILLSYGQTVDIYGHLGGFVCGVAVTCEFNKNIRDLPGRLQFPCAAGLALSITGHGPSASA